MKTISIKNNQLIIKIPYDTQLVNLVKISFSGRKWDSGNKVWSAPLKQKNLAMAKQFVSLHGFTLSNELVQEFEKYQEMFENENKEMDKKVELSKATDSDIEIPTTIKGVLFPFQKAGVQFIERTNGRTLLADEPGIGKSFQSIAWCQLHPEKRPILVICPKTIILNWKREFEKWTDIKAFVFDSKNCKSELPISGYEAYIINYDIVEKQKELLKRYKFQIVILDECTMIKNQKAKRTKAVDDLMKGIPHVLALTGTPTLNSRPIEVFPILKILDPKNFGNYFEYARKFCNMTRTRWGLDVSGASNIDELATKLRSTVMIRREKKDVLKELPDKTRCIIPQEIDLTEYNIIENDLINYLIESKNKSKQQAEKINQVEQLAKIEYLKQQVVREKLPLFVEWVKDFIESGNKLVIFVHHREFLEKLMVELKEYNPVKIMGGMSNEDKQKSIDSFQNDKNCKIFIGSITSAGMGITLTSASHLVFLELMFVPALHDQAEDRILRIGQKNACTIYYFIADKTIEQDIYNLLQNKRRIFQELMQDKHTITENTDTNILNDLINTLVNK